jgi:hypothetical protein
VQAGSVRLEPELAAAVVENEVAARASGTATAASVVRRSVASSTGGALVAQAPRITTVVAAPRTVHR